MSVTARQVKGDLDDGESALKTTTPNEEASAFPLKPLIFGSLAAAFEWYDFALFGYFAAIIGNQFFPAEDPMTSLLSSFAVLASGFAMRPIGSILFGYVGDRKGRKFALGASLLTMAVPTTALGLLPTYESIGIWASVGLVMIRLLQGLAVGGNYGGSFIFTIEHAPKGIKGFAGSLASFGTMGGLFLGSGAATILTAVMDPVNLQSYGWRIPFLMGVLAAVVGLMIRHYIPDQAEDVASRQIKQTPVRQVWEDHMPSLLKCIGIILLDGVGCYVVFIFMTAYATQFLGLPNDAVLLINTITMGTLVATIPISGWLGDKITQTRVLMGIGIGFIIFSFPLFWLLIDTRAVWSLALLQGIFSVLMGSVYGTAPGAVAGAFPRSTRYTASGLAFNMSVAVFGGTAPFVVTMLISKTGNLMVPAIALTVVGFISFFSAKTLKTTLD